MWYPGIYFIVIIIIIIIIITIIIIIIIINDNKEINLLLGKCTLCILRIQITSAILLGVLFHISVKNTLLNQSTSLQNSILATSALLLFKSLKTIKRVQNLWMSHSSLCKSIYQIPVIPGKKALTGLLRTLLETWGGMGQKRPYRSPCCNLPAMDRDLFH